MKNINSLQILDKKLNLQKRATALFDKAEEEGRMLTEEEQKLYEEIKAQIAELEKQKSELEAKLNEEASDEEEEDKEVASDEEEDEDKIEQNKRKKRNMKFSLLNAINSVVNNRSLDENTQKVINRGVNQMRNSGLSYGGQIQIPIENRATDGTLTGGNLNSTTTNGGKEAVPTDTLDILTALRNKLVLVQAGATCMNGLVGNVEIPVYSGSTVGWEGEVDAASNGTGTMSSVELSPKRITAYVDVSKQFLIQTSDTAEAMLKNDIVEAISNKLEETILGTEAGSNKKPAGILNGVTADTTAVKYADIVSMEATLEAANIDGDYKVIVSPTAKAKLKTTSVDAGSGRFIMESNEVDGYEALTTNAVPANGVIFGNFNELVIGQWGAFDVTVDPYTQAANGKVRLVVNAYFDAKLRRTGAVVGKILA